jgi:putative inorganic carbon (HCO3(-)) transporter
MLSQLLFLVVFLGVLPAALISPFAGALIYKWFEYLPPAHTYSVTLIPGNLSFFIGALTILVWLAQEKKTVPRPPALFHGLIALLVWVNVTTFFAVVPEAAVVKWDRTVKVLIFSILMAQMMSQRVRIEAFLWLVVACTAYFAVPGAIKTVVSGGGGVSSGLVVVGEVGSFVGDRNVIAVVFVMVLPLVLYLRKHATLLRPSPWVNLGLLGIAGAILVALLGTYSRGGLLAGTAMLLMLILKSQRKSAGLVGVGATALVLLVVAPDSWFARMNTLGDFERDNSAMGRLLSWGWAWNMALEHPIVGGGFRIFVKNFSVDPKGYTEAHSIYFEVLAEHGFVGLTLFLGLLLIGYRNCTTVTRLAAGRDEFAWAADLSRALQVSLIGFAVGGAFLSISTSPFFYDYLAIVIGVRSIVEREIVLAAREGNAGRLLDRPQPGVPLTADSPPARMLVGGSASWEGGQ